MIINMTEDQFKILHSEIMMYFQCIEFDLKRIYSGMSADDFDEEMDMLEISNLGNTLRKLKNLTIVMEIHGYLRPIMNNLIASERSEITGRISVIWIMSTLMIGGSARPSIKELPIVLSMNINVSISYIINYRIYTSIGLKRIS